MSKEQQEAQRIIELYYILNTEQVIKAAQIHVEGIIDEIQDMDWEFSSRIAAERLEYWGDVLEILKSK